MCLCVDAIRCAVIWSFQGAGAKCDDRRMSTADKVILEMSVSLHMQSAVLGFGVFRVLERYGITSALSIGENVILQTTSVATATMPLAAGKRIHLHVSALSALAHMPGCQECGSHVGMHVAWQSWSPKSKSEKQAMRTLKESATGQQ